MAYVSLVKMWFVCVTHIWVAVCYGSSCVSQSKLCVQRLKKIFHVKDDTFNDDENLKLEGRDEHLKLIGARTQNEFENINHAHFRR